MFPVASGLSFCRLENRSRSSTVCQALLWGYGHTGEQGRPSLPAVLSSKLSFFCRLNGEECGVSFLGAFKFLSLIPCLSGSPCIDILMTLVVLSLQLFLLSGSQEPCPPDRLLLAYILFDMPRILLCRPLPMEAFPF